MPSIVDVVLDRQVGRSKQRRVAAFVAAIVLYASLGLVVVWWDPSLEAWAAEIASHVHAELDRTQPVSVEVPPPPPPPVRAPAPAPVPATSARAPAPTPTSRPAPPAAAAKVLAADPAAPADFTGTPIVSGTAKQYAGGATSATSPHDHPSPAAAGPPADSKARPVGRRGDSEWRCPWPSEAESLELDTQSATIRIRVSATGDVLDIRSVDDPGYGFGRAARACAQGTRWEPALDDDGTPIERWSPPVIVRFERR